MHIDICRKRHTLKLKKMNFHVLTSMQAADQTKAAGMTNKSIPLFYKRTLSNGMEIFDFDEDLIIDQMEKMMASLENIL